MGTSLTYWMRDLPISRVLPPVQWVSLVSSGASLQTASRGAQARSLRNEGRQETGSGAGRGWWEELRDAGREPSTMLATCQGEIEKGPGSLGEPPCPSG
jgi:hypothetical protein